MTRAYRIETRDWHGCFYAAVLNATGSVIHETHVHSLREDARKAAERWLKSHKAQAREDALLSA